MLAQELSRDARAAMAALHGIMLILKLCGEYGSDLKEPTLEEALEYMEMKQAPESQDQEAVLRFQAMYLKFLAEFWRYPKNVKEAIRETEEMAIIDSHFMSVTP